MNKIALLSAGLAAMIVPLLPATPAQAALRTWVASNGVDMNNNACSRTQPCLTFQQAHDKTDPNGEINCVDAGSGFISSFVFITKSITIDCPLGAILGINTTGVTIVAPGSVVRLRNLSMNGSVAGVIAIDFADGAALFVENCVIANFNHFDAIGIKFRPSAAAQLVVTDTTVSTNGTGLTGGGIIIQPTGSGTRDIVLTRVQVENNVTGIRVDGSGSTGVIQATVRDSVLSGNKTGSGVTAVTTPGGAATTVFLDRTAVVSNGTGTLANGALAAVLLNNSTIQANSVALATANGGALFSYKNNSINNNGTPGAAPTVVAQN